jgi:hypothetical protein
MQAADQSPERKSKSVANPQRPSTIQCSAPSDTRRCEATSSRPGRSCPGIPQLMGSAVTNGLAVAASTSSPIRRRSRPGVWSSSMRAGLTAYTSTMLRA